MTITQAIAGLLLLLTLGGLASVIRIDCQEKF
jgi:hypothetical protein